MPAGFAATGGGQTERSSINSRNAQNYFPTAGIRMVNPRGIRISPCKEHLIIADQRRSGLKRGMARFVRLKDEQAIYHVMIRGS